MMYHEFYPGSEPLESFKCARENVQPVETESFERLYTAIARVLFRTEIVPIYANDYNNMLTPNPRRHSDFVEEQWGPARTADGRLLHLVVYTDRSKKREFGGMIASAGIARGPARNIRSVFDLSTDGTHSWVTENNSTRGITNRELRRLTLDLERA